MKLKTTALSTATVLLLSAAIIGTLNAKSLYVIKDLNALSPISAYDIQPSPSYLVWQQTSGTTHYGGVGIAIDSDSEILFVTYEGYSTIRILDAKTFVDYGTISAPNATNLSGIVYDHDNSKVYCVQRGTNHLYIYSWNPTTKTLTNDITTSPYYFTLSGIYFGGCYGIALDEVSDLLYVGDRSTSVKIFNTSDWSSAGSRTVSQPVMGVAVDVLNGFLYTGNAYGPYGSVGRLCKYDLNTETETHINIRTLTGGVSSDNVVGLSVDPATSLLYITTGNQGSGGSDRIIVFNSSLVMQHATGDIGNPTGIVVPGRDISYNPLNLAITDNPLEYVCPGANITYTYSFDNTLNTFGVHNTTLTTQLHPWVSYVSSTGGGTYNAGLHMVNWNVGTLAAGATTVSYDVVVQVLTTAPWDANIPVWATIDSDETPPTTKNGSTEVEDVTPPTITTLTLSHSILWPPNHEYVTITATIAATDNCAPWCTTSMTLTSATSSESDNGLGDGDTENDIVIVDNTTVKLRAERSGKGTGRTYTLTYTATDCRGNTTVGTATVFVPHDMAKSIAGFDSTIPDHVSLEQNYPNPFNPSTVISFALPRDMQARLVVYDLLSSEITTLVNDYLPAGQYNTVFDASSFSSGLYFYRLETAERTVTKTMRMIK